QLDSGITISSICCIAAGSALPRVRTGPNYPALDESAIREQFVVLTHLPTGTVVHCQENQVPTRESSNRPSPPSREAGRSHQRRTRRLGGWSERERRAQDRYEHGRSVSRLQMKLRLKEELANRLPQRLETPPSMDEGGEADSNSGSDGSREHSPELILRDSAVVHFVVALEEWQHLGAPFADLRAGIGNSECRVGSSPCSPVLSNEQQQFVNRLLSLGRQVVDAALRLWHKLLRVSQRSLVQVLLR
uniref:PI3K/PI4K domain-containing protein n=1 Tax=Macrostomum lignano TaxID=282301 RepID=A0A1I8FNF7_9PLAT